MIVSYFQAGRICDYINEKWGWDKLLAMMHDFADSEATAEVIAQRTGHRAGGVRQGVSGVARSRNQERRRRLRRLAEEAERGRRSLPRAKKYDEVIKRRHGHSRPVSRIMWKPAASYELLAEAYLAKDDKPAAIAELERYAEAAAAAARQPVKKLATLLAEAGRKKDAAAALERINYISPQDR